jgi:hypothetical protein
VLFERVRAGKCLWLWRCERESLLPRVTGAPSMNMSRRAVTTWLLDRVGSEPDPLLSYMIS